MYNVRFEHMITKESYHYVDDCFELIIYGRYFESPNVDLISKKLNACSHQYDFLNFDGGYTAFLLDKKNHKQIIFCSHKRSFDLFYIKKGQNVIFSDSFYYLVSQFRLLTWNLHSLSDYFEPSWNHICKYDRTPFCEISKLDTGKYIEISPLTFRIQQKNWLNWDKTILYDDSNLDSFSEKFFETLDYYLEKIYEENEKVAISLSGGIDTNTIAAEWSRRFSDKNTTFFTSKIDDTTDESQMASCMQSKISSKIQFIPIKLEQTNLIDELYSHMQTFVPPRFLNLLSEKYFYNQLIKSGITMPYITGMGADGLFGAFGGEYHWLMKELIEKKEYCKAKNVYTAIQVSFCGSKKDISEIENEFNQLIEKSPERITVWKKCRYMLSTLKQSIKKVLQNNLYKDDLFLVKLPKPESSKISNYSEARKYSSYDGATIDQSLLCSNLGLPLYYPYEGYKFLELSAHCDPYIFSNKINKTCMRYAVRKLLPKEILDNKLKIGQPGVTEEKVFKNNKSNILNFLENKVSTVIDMDVLKSRIVDDKFGQNEFLSLSLVVFEDICKNKLHIEIKQPK